MNRIDKTFNELKEKNEKALITFLTAGDPSIEKTKKAIFSKIKSGVDIIEIGIPYSDPLADGPTIQAASQRALDNGVTLEKIFDMVKEVREESQIPLVFLVYYNTLLGFGVETFISSCKEIGIDGLIIPDLPLEERDELLPYLKDSEIYLIPLVAPTSKERISSIIKGMGGFVYCVSTLGVTGNKGGFYRDVDNFLTSVKEISHLPIAVGFGVSSSEDFKRFSPFVDGVIVGSAVVSTLEKCNIDDFTHLENFIQNLR